MLCIVGVDRSDPVLICLVISMVFLSDWVLVTIFSCVVGFLCLLVIVGLLCGLCSFVFSSCVSVMVITWLNVSPVSCVFCFSFDFMCICVCMLLSCCCRCVSWLVCWSCVSVSDASEFSCCMSYLLGFL